MIYIVPNGLDEFYDIKVDVIESAGDLSQKLAECNFIRDNIYISCHPRVFDFLKIFKPDIKIVVDIPRIENEPSMNLLDIDKVSFDQIEHSLKQVTQVAEETDSFNSMEVEDNDQS